MKNTIMSLFKHRPNVQLRREITFLSANEALFRANTIDSKFYPGSFKTC